jgi:hypothetical protein
MVRIHWAPGVVAAFLFAGACGGSVSNDDGRPADDGSLTDRPIDSPFDPPIDAPPIDGPVDAPVDAAGCGTDVRLIGEYLDWDSNNANYMGIGGSQWTVVGDLSRMTQSAPNGNVVLCLNPAAPSQISVGGAGAYLPALFLADPAVFMPAGSRFAARGLRTMDPGGASTQYMEFGVTYNGGLAQILVYKIGAAIPLALEPAINPPQQTFVSDGTNDITWSAGDTGTFTLFPNRPFGGGTATLTSTANFTGPTTIPIASGRFTIVVIR